MRCIDLFTIFVVFQRNAYHDGFCLFDTKLTDYNSMNAACHKDLVKEFLEAFRAEGSAEVVVITAKVREGDFRTAMEELSGRSSVRKVSSMLRVYGE